MATVSLNDVNKIYSNGAHAVRGVNMDIEDGEFIVYVGPSGCGKSTLLRMIAGLETITSGIIKIDDRLINDVTPAERDVAMVFQNYALYPHMTVRGNMSYGLKNRGISKAEIAKIVDDTAKMLKIADFLDRQPHQLSGGQRQRVAMGRAIVRNPKVFLFDEPLSNLDAKLRVQMRIEIRRLQRRLGVTTVYVTHDQTEAMTLADRLAVINDGLIEQMDTPMELYNNPQSLFVAGFIGSPPMNFFSGKISDDGGTIELGSGLKIAAGNYPVGENKGKPVQIGIRAEKIEPCSKSEAELMLNIAAVETLGSETLVHGVLDMEAAEDLDNSTVVKLSSDARPEVGDELPVRVLPDGLHLFDVGTGTRI
jgi:sn-glycerol 3-phosphate transport system ATP-binding protein